jgi:oligo-1,6-glucosidase
MMTVGGTIFLHQGQEIGAQNLTDKVCLHEYKDMLTHSDINNHRVHRIAAQGKLDVDMSDIQREVLLKARDHARLPMAWDDSEGAGFTTGKPWMTLGTTYKRINVADQEKSDHSVLNTWRAMIALRKQYPEELVYGSFELVDEGHEQVFAYARTAKGGTRILIALNWSDQAVSWQTPETYGSGKVLKTVGGVEHSGGKVHLFPYASVVWRFCCWWC